MTTTVPDFVLADIRLAACVLDNANFDVACNLVERGHAIADWRAGYWREKVIGARAILAKIREVAMEQGFTGDEWNTLVESCAPECRWFPSAQMSAFDFDVEDFSGEIEIA